MVSLLQRECDLSQVKQVCDRIPLKFDLFPSMREISEVIADIKRYGTPNPYKKEIRWVSSRAPGTPACIEALFDWYEQGNPKPKAFEFGLRYCKLNDKEFFDAYELFVQGKVHEKIVRLADVPVQQALFEAKTSSTDQPQSVQQDLL